MAKAKASGAPNLFAQAVVAEAITKPSGKEAKNKKLEVAFGAELDQLAAIDAVIKTCEGLKTMATGQVKSQMMDEFVRLTVANGARPDNFTGVSEKATASCELRDKGQKLNEGEREVLDALGVPYKENVDMEVQERFFFNPEIMNDQELLGKISKALTKIPELAGLNVIMLQRLERQTSHSVNDETYAAIAKLGDADKVKAAYQVAATLAVKPKVKDSLSTLKAMETIVSLITTAEKTAEKAAKSKAN